jgi:hypothetical protein
MMKQVSQSVLQRLPRQGKPQGAVRRRERWQAELTRMGMAAAASVLASGCINVQAPDKPIVIELNINIRQEVIYRLAADAANTIDENADIF